MAIGSPPSICRGSVDAESAASVGTVAPRGTETVLVVESEGVVREYVRTLLERHGYHALLAEGPRDAFSQTQGDESRSRDREPGAARRGLRASWCRR